VTIYLEIMPVERWVGFALVWVALLVLTLDGLRRNRQATQPRRTQPQRDERSREEPAARDAVAP
jgi:chloramphenicol-sensitive protein RarD